MQRALPVLAAVAAISAAVVIGQAADAQTQGGSGSFQTQPNTFNPDNTPLAKPGQAAPFNQNRPGNFQGPSTQCMTGYSQKELKLDGFGKLSRMTCQSPVMRCPAPATGYTVGFELAKQPINPDTGAFRLQYRCVYYRNVG